MRLFIHVLTDCGRIEDTVGSDFSGLSAGIAEAVQTARDLMADALKAGRFAPVGWRMEVADAKQAVLFSTSFEECAIEEAYLRRRHLRLV